MRIRIFIYFLIQMQIYAVGTDASESNLKINRGELVRPLHSVQLIDIDEDVCISFLKGKAHLLLPEGTNMFLAEGKIVRQGDQIEVMENSVVGLGSVEACSDTVVFLSGSAWYKLH